TEAGHHFVEDQQRSMTLGDFTQSFEETGSRWHTVHVAGYWLNNQTRDVFAVFGKQRSDSIQVVERNDEGLRSGFGRNARGVRVAEGQTTGTSFYQQRIHVAVITAFELHDLVALGAAAC